MGKQCTSCKKVLPELCFGRRGADPHGRRQCKACNNAVSAQSRAGCIEDTPGYVYVAWTVHGSSYKVGRTRLEWQKLKRRYSTHLPHVQLKMVPVQNHRAAEKRLHAALRKYCIEGEHFARCREVDQILEEFVCGFV